MFVDIFTTVFNKMNRLCLKFSAPFFQRAKASLHDQDRSKIDSLRSTLTDRLIDRADVIATTLNRFISSIFDDLSCLSFCLNLTCSILSLSLSPL